MRGSFYNWKDQMYKCREMDKQDVKEEITASVNAMENIAGELQTN